MSRVDADTTLTEAEQVSCRFAMRTDMGLRRTENQDTYGYVRSRLSSLFIVADGMGGARGGATASAIAVDVVCREVSRQPLTEETLKRAIERANRAIFDRSRDDENLQGMGTTFVALALIGARGFLAHVGDSRAYLLRDGALTKLTRDHTLIQELLETGAISDDQAENHPIAHMLTRSLGPARAVEVEFSPLPGPLRRGDRFLLCCDGLYNMVSDEEIAKILGGDVIDTVAQGLVDKANASGGTDNITVEVIDVCPINEGQSDLAVDELEFFTSSDLDLSDLSLEDAGASESALETGAPVNGHNGNANGELSNAERAAGDRIAAENSSAEPAKGADKNVKKSSIDSIIFGEMPTDQDIRDHHESVKKSSSPATVTDVDGSSVTDASVGDTAEKAKNSGSATESGDDHETTAGDEDVDRIVETREIKVDVEGAEVNEREAQNLRRIQYGAIAAVAIAVFAAAMVLIPGKRPATQVATSESSAPEAPAESTEALKPGPVEPESGKPVGQGEPIVPVETALGSTEQPVVTPTVKLTEPEHSEAGKLDREPLDREPADSGPIQPESLKPIPLEKLPSEPVIAKAAPILASPGIEVASLDSPFALPEQAPMIAPPEKVIEAVESAAATSAAPTPAALAVEERSSIEAVSSVPVAVTAPVETPPVETHPVEKQPVDIKPIDTKPLNEATVTEKVAPETAAPEKSATEPLSVSTSSKNAVASVATEAWPEAKVTSSTTEAKLQALAVPTTAQKDDPNLTPYLAKDSDPGVARVIAEAGELAVPTPPVVKDPNLSEAPDQPIVWEHEQVALQKALTAPASAADGSGSVVNSTSATAEAKQGQQTGTTLEATDDEKKTLYQKKIELRDKISAVDARIRAFGLRTVDEAKKQLTQLDGELDIIDRAVEQVSKNIEIAKRRYQVWMNRKDFLVTGSEPFKLADEVATNSELVKRKKEAHDVTSVRYLDAVERWRANPSDNAATQSMTTLGRELRERRAEVEESIVKTVDSSLDQVISDLAEFGTTKSNLEKQRDRVNRQMGFIKAYNVNAKDNRLERQRKLMDERRQLASELESLRGKMPDQDEVIYRRSLIVSQYALPK